LVIEGNQFENVLGAGMAASTSSNAVAAMRSLLATVVSIKAEANRPNRSSENKYQIAV
jgi:hypothetical protein